MPKLPRITGEKLVKALEKEGFELVRQRGSHVQMRKFVEEDKVTFPIPVHKGKTLKPGTLKGILRKAGISVERLVKRFGNIDETTMAKVEDRLRILLGL